MTELSGVAGLAARLRRLQHQNDWTVQEMADRAGVPKRSMENYCRKQNPQLPSVEVVVKMADGLGVSVEWLLIGDTRHAEAVGRMVRLATRAAALPFIQHFIIQRNLGFPMDESEEKLFGMTAEEWALEIAYQAGRRAEDVVSHPGTATTLETLEAIAFRSRSDGKATDPSATE
ncbi:MAG: helix-turn-helix transcriptional regulator [Rhodobacter sp.]|nr:helix-turn-helix transcriptional regulator [Rhodobacter sp.]MCA3470603.1 helix-turn-helix transcriptional regulator [Rhodobacter sp.]MCA3480141.1 helix-turn-helix transcriptional regulator [Rhodobacter sp.]MCA3496267.1 helix-turn-helix transcriptional regulator [Rhodobacter sp.]